MGKPFLITRRQLKRLTSLEKSLRIMAGELDVVTFPWGVHLILRAADLLNALRGEFPDFTRKQLKQPLNEPSGRPAPAIKKAKIK